MTMSRQGGPTQPLDAYSRECHSLGIKKLQTEDLADYGSCENNRVGAV